MAVIVPLLRELLNARATEGLQPNACATRHRDVASGEFNRIQTFLSDYMNTHASLPQLAKT